MPAAACDVARHPAHFDHRLHASISCTAQRNRRLGRGHWLRAADMLPVFPPAAAASYADRVAGSRWYRCLAGFFSDCLRERFVDRYLLRCSCI